ncbi:MAG: helix-hairpin-helix domain-containing protein [Bdellovibrionales bacterium]|nr:helix-hairpin-helix domain-containing protein [Bdellovibrionales bacterium]
MKAKVSAEAKKLTDIPNVGPATAKDFNLLGIEKPNDLVGKDPINLFKKLCKVTGVEHDPCTADIFMSAVSFMDGEGPRDWWEFTEERKRILK